MIHLLLALHLLSCSSGRAAAAFQPQPPVVLASFRLRQWRYTQRPGPGILRQSSLSCEPHRTTPGQGRPLHRCNLRRAGSLDISLTPICGQHHDRPSRGTGSRCLPSEFTGKCRLQHTGLCKADSECEVPNLKTDPRFRRLLGANRPGLPQVGIARRAASAC